MNLALMSIYAWWSVITLWFGFWFRIRFMMIILVRHLIQLFLDQSILLNPQQFHINMFRNIICILYLHHLPIHKWKNHQDLSLCIISWSVLNRQYFIMAQTIFLYRQYWIWWWNWVDVGEGRYYFCRCQWPFFLCLVLALVCNSVNLDLDRLEYKQYKPKHTANDTNRNNTPAIIIHNSIFKHNLCWFWTWSDCPSSHFLGESTVVQYNFVIAWGWVLLCGH